MTITRHESEAAYSNIKQMLFSKLLTQLQNKEGQGLGRLVPLGCTAHTASTCGLSTSSSRTALTLSMGYLILKHVSRLDAFSAYHSWT